MPPVLVILQCSSATYEVISLLFASRIIIPSPVFSIAEFCFVRKFLLWVNCSNFFWTCHSEFQWNVLPIYSMCNRLVKRSYHFHNSSVILRMSPPSFSFWPSPPSSHASPFSTCSSLHLYMSIIPLPSSVFRPSFSCTGCSTTTCHMCFAEDDVALEYSVLMQRFRGHTMKINA